MQVQRGRDIHLVCVYMYTYIHLPVIGERNCFKRRRCRCTTYLHLCLSRKPVAALLLASCRYIRTCMRIFRCRLIDTCTRCSSALLVALTEAYLLLWRPTYKSVVYMYTHEDKSFNDRIASLSLSTSFFVCFQLFFHFLVEDHAFSSKNTYCICIFFFSLNIFVN